jgi:hypothetical protein
MHQMGQVLFGGYVDVQWEGQGKILPREKFGALILASEIIYGKGTIGGTDFGKQPTRHQLEGRHFHDEEAEKVDSKRPRTLLTARSICDVALFRRQGVIVPVSRPIALIR